MIPPQALVVQYPGSPRSSQNREPPAPIRPGSYGRTVSHCRHNGVSNGTKRITVWTQDAGGLKAPPLDATASQHGPPASLYPWTGRCAPGSRRLPQARRSFLARPLVPVNLILLALSYSDFHTETPHCLWVCMVLSQPLVVQYPGSPHSSQNREIPAPMRPGSYGRTISHYRHNGVSNGTTRITVWTQDAGGFKAPPLDATTSQHGPLPSLHLLGENVRRVSRRPPTTR